METLTKQQLVKKKCKPCEGFTDPCSLQDAQAQLAKLSAWHLTHGGNRIRRDWVVKDFMTAIDFFNRIATIAESDGHHPDLHIKGYRNITIELWTHAIRGLSENDFILAAKIDELSVELQKDDS